MKFPEVKIGEVASRAGDWLAQKIEQAEARPAAPAAPAAPASPPKIPLPPPIRPQVRVRRAGR
jgi:hypothetical protein